MDCQEEPYQAECVTVGSCMWGFYCSLLHLPYTAFSLSVDCQEETYQAECVTVGSYMWGFTVCRFCDVFLALVLCCCFQGLFSQAFDLEARECIDDDGHTVVRKQSWYVTFFLDEFVV